MDIQKKIIEIIAHHAVEKPEDLKPESHLFDNLAMDSLDIVELMMALEEEFQIEIPDEDAANLLTVEQVVQYVTEKTKK